MFSAQHGKEKKERMAKKRGRGKDKKKEGLCSPLERRADVDVGVKEGGEKNGSKARQKTSQSKKQESFSLGFLFCGSVMGTESSSFPHALQREMKAVKLYNVFHFVSRQKQVLRLRAAQQEERETSMRPV